jgi:hypothetical protein
MVMNQNVRAGSRQLQGDGAANSTGAPGDKSGLTLKINHG